MLLRKLLWLDEYSEKDRFELTRFFGSAAYTDIQGVPRNMTEARRIEGRLWSFEFASYSPRPSFKRKILTITIKNTPSLKAFQKCCLLFCAFNITGDMTNFVKIWYYLKNWNLNEILNITGNIYSTKKADHILEMPGHRKNSVLIVPRMWK